MAVADRFYTPGMDTSNDGFEVDYTEHILPIAGTNVHVYEWLPSDVVADTDRAATGPTAVVHISHGAGDHARRYQRIARILAAAGYAVVADDHLGHGRTGVAAFGLSNLGPGGLAAARGAVREVIRWSRARYPGLPLIEFGHSWGSLLGQQLFLTDPELFDGVVWSGSTLALPGFINTGNFNAQWEGDGHGMSWISADPVEVQAMIDDLYGFDIAKSSVWTPLEAVQLLTVPPLPRRGRAARVPVLILAGEEDVIGFGPRGPRALAWGYRHISRLKDVTLRVYPGSRHEVINDLSHEQVRGDLLNWLRWHFEAPEQTKVAN